MSTDKGLSFTDYPIYTNASNTKEFFNVQFPNVAVDQGGNVYAGYSDGHNLWYSFSTNHGQTWKGPIKVNQAPSLTAIFPWMAAGAPGKLDIVWYGSSQPGSYTPFSVDLYPSSVQWFVYFAQNLNALSTTSKFTQTVASGPNPIHFGNVCTLGGNCQSYRQLFDYFGVTADPTTGMATIIYDNARYDPTVANNNLPNPDCNSTYDDKLICVHTDIAHQISGSGVFRNHSFEIRDESLREESDGTHADYRNSIYNSGDASIKSISVSLAGVSIPLTFNSTFPLQPGSTISSTSVVSLQTFALLLGTAYPTMITATFDDGTTLSQPSSVVFSLT